MGVVAGSLAACGGGGSPSTLSTATDLTLSGTAATGKAIAAATITAKCTAGSGTVSTMADGTYQLLVTGGKLPCLLEITNPSDGSTLHTVAVGTGNAASANITPLTEMLVARLVGKQPAVFFGAFDAAAASTVTTAAVKAAQADVSTILSGTLDTSSLADFIATPLKAATADNPAGGDAQDRLLDALAAKLNGAQLAQVMTALANPASTVADIKQAVTRIAVVRFAYVGNADDKTISAYAVNATTGALSTTGAASMAVPYAFAFSFAADPAGKFAYQANWSRDTVSAYTINANTGALSSVGSPVATGQYARSVTLHPTGHFAYVINAADDTVSAYGIDATSGALTRIGTVATGSGPTGAVALDSTGKFAYVANSAGVSAYTVNTSTGSLTASGLATAGGGSHTVTVDPAGTYAYVVNDGDRTISAYSINATSGVLTGVGIPVATGNSGGQSNSHTLTIAPTGKFAYLPNWADNTISVYAIDTASGVLSSIGTVATGSGPFGFTLDPAGQFAYVTNSTDSTVSTYLVNATSGALTSTGAAVATGKNPQFIVTTK